MPRALLRTTLILLAAAAVAYVVGSRRLREDRDAAPGSPSPAVESVRENEFLGKDAGGGNVVAVDSPAAEPEARRIVESAGPSGTTWVLDGWVTDDRETPLPDAELALFSGDLQDPEHALQLATCRSAADGSFRLDAPDAAGPLFVFADARGHADTLAAVVRGEPARIRLRRLQSEVLLVGRVVDERSRLLPAFEILQPTRVDRPDGGIELRSNVRRVVQSSDGFELEWYLSGDKTLHIRARGFQDHIASIRPDGSDRIDAGEIVMLRGDASCWGSVVDLRGRPLGDVAIEPRLSTGSAPQRLRTDAAGAFEFSLPAGSEVRSLLVVAPDLAPRWVHAADVGGIWEDVRIVLDDGGRITGWVRNKGLAAAGVAVCAWLFTPDGEDMGGGGPGWTPWRRTVLTNAQGQYLMERVPAGRIGLAVVLSSEGEALRRISRVVVESGNTHTADFELGDGALAVGGLELPEFLSEESFTLELRTPAADDGGHGLATSRVVDGRYRFEDVAVSGAGQEAVLRIHFAPRHFLDRPVFIGPGDNDLGTLDLTSPSVLAEFNRPGREVFAIRPANSR